MSEPTAAAKLSAERIAEIEAWVPRGLDPRAAVIRVDEALTLLAAIHERDAEIARLKAYIDSLHTLRPAAEYHEDYGDVLWWKLPIMDPPYVGSPLDSCWQKHRYERYYTHWSHLPDCTKFVASDGSKVTT